MVIGGAFSKAKSTSIVKKKFLSSKVKSRDVKNAPVEDDDDDNGIDKYLCDSDDSAISAGTFSDLDDEERQRLVEELKKEEDNTNDIMKLVDPTTEQHLKLCKSMQPATAE